MFSVLRLLTARTNSELSVDSGSLQQVLVQTSLVPLATFAIYAIVGWSMGAGGGCLTAVLLGKFGLTTRVVLFSFDYRSEHPFDAGLREPLVKGVGPCYRQGIRDMHFTCRLFCANFCDSDPSHFFPDEQAMAARSGLACSVNTRAQLPDTNHFKMAAEQAFDLACHIVRSVAAEGLVCGCTVSPGADNLCKTRWNMCINRKLRMSH